MKVTYELPATPFRGRNRLAILVAFLAVLSIASLIVLPAIGPPPALYWLLWSMVGFMIFGANTVTYEAPVTGVTPPTAAQSRAHQSISAVITGDGAAVTFTLTHNWGLSAAENTLAFPWVEYEQLLASGYTAAPLITSKNPNTVVFGNTAFAGAGLRVRLLRPWTPLR